MGVGTRIGVYFVSSDSIVLYLVGYIWVYAIRLIRMIGTAIIFVWLYLGIYTQIFISIAIGILVSIARMVIFIDTITHTAIALYTGIDISPMIIILLVSISRNTAHL